MINFNEIMESANKLVIALEEGTFDTVFHEEITAKPLVPAEISYITEVAEVYKQVKDGRISRDEGISRQKKLKAEYQKDASTL